MFYAAQILHEVFTARSKGEGEQEKETEKPSARSLVIFL